MCCMSFHFMLSLYQINFHPFSFLPMLSNINMHAFLLTQLRATCCAPVLEGIHLLSLFCIDRCGNSNQYIYGIKGKGFNHKDITQDVSIIVCLLDLILAEQTHLILLYFHSKLRMVFVTLSCFCFCSSASSASYKLLTWWHSRSYQLQRKQALFWASNNWLLFSLGILKNVWSSEIQFGC